MCTSSRREAQRPKTAQRPSQPASGNEGSPGEDYYKEWKWRQVWSESKQSAAVLCPPV